MSLTAEALTLPPSSAHCIHFLVIAMHVLIIVLADLKAYQILVYFEV